MAAAFDITDPEALEKFLAGKPVAWSRLIASRSALRVLPILLTHPPDRSLDREKLQTAGLRACFISWAAGKYPAHDMADAARAAARSAVGSAHSRHPAAHSAYAAVRSIAESAKDSARFAAESAADSAFFTARFAALSADSANDSADWEAVNADLAWLDRPNPALVDPLLWHGPPPDWAQDVWRNFELRKLVGEEGYAPWINWYNHLLLADGESSRDIFGERLTIRVATQPDEWWKQTAAVINADITSWLEVPRALAQAVASLPAQGPAPFSFEVREDRLFLATIPGVADPGGVVQDYLNESREKASPLLQRLNQSNAAVYVTATIENLLTRLPAKAQDIRPALLDSRRLSISAIATAYQAPGAEQELFPDAVAQILDLSLTLDRLCALLPELRAMQADETAQAVISGNVPVLLQAATQVAELVERSQLLDSSASEAVKLVLADANEPALPAAKARRAVYLVETIRNLLLELFKQAGPPIAALLNEAKSVLKDGYKAFRPKLVKTVSGSMTVSLTYLVETVAGPIGTLASLAGFKNINEVVQLILRLIS
jgi:hypothetical protein